jgi:hypothetical protein
VRQQVSLFDIRDFPLSDPSHLDRHPGHGCRRNGRTRGTGT